jgi:hypothetical protein
MTTHKTHFGYFDDPDQTVPAFDPGLDAPCPACLNVHLGNWPVVTISLMVPGDNRSYFYRMHKRCYEQLNDDQRNIFDSDIIDAIMLARNVN